MATPVDIVPDESPVVPAKDKPASARSAPTEPVFADAVSSEPARSEPVTTEPDVFLPAPPPPPAPKKVTAASQNPFSVEEIEAEFARLLGRPLDKKG